jgi:tetratricopeptide (TPR) repeat protein
MIGASTRARRRWQLARYWQARGDLTEAGRHARHAVRLAGHQPAPAPLVAEILLTAAEVHRDLADYPTAATYWAEAAALLDRTAAGPDRDRLLVRALTGLGDAHRRAGEHPTASAALDRAIALAADLVAADPMLYAAALTVAGIVAKETSAFDTAERTYAQVAQLLDRATAGPAETATLAHNLAGLAYARGDADDDPGAGQHRLHGQAGLSNAMVELVPNGVGTQVLPQFANARDPIDDEHLQTRLQPDRGHERGRLQQRRPERR